MRELFSGATYELIIYENQMVAWRIGFITPRRKSHRNNTGQSGSRTLTIRFPDVKGVIEG